jgi:tetratricopeptide (TPR) repeat protein
VNALLSPPAVGWAADVARLRGRLAAVEADDVAGPTAAAERLTLRHRLAILTGGQPAELLALLAQVDATVERFPEWPDLRLLQGSLGLALHRPDLAAAALAALDELRDQPPVQLLAADLAAFTGAYPRAQELYGAANRRDPQWNSWARIADLHIATGRLDEAEHCFDEAEDELSVKQMRAFAWVRVQRGDLARAVGDPDLAAARYDEADRAYPGWWHVAARRAALDAARGRPDAAVAGYLSVLADADRPEFREGLGTALAAAGRPFEAATCLESALAEYTASAERGEVHYLHHLAGYWLARDPEVAVGWARRDVDVRRDGHTLSTLAECLFRAGRVVEARQTLREALALGAGSPRLRALVAEIGV